MDPALQALLAAIQSFPIDDGNPALTIEARLARDHGWSRPYARQVILEYPRQSIESSGGCGAGCGG
jgi:hypothetical protein